MQLECQKKTKNEIEKIFEKIMSKSFQNFMKHTYLQIQEAQWTPRSINTSTEGGVKIVEE